MSLLKIKIMENKSEVNLWIFFCIFHFKIFSFSINSAKGTWDISFEIKKKLNLKFHL